MPVNQRHVKTTIETLLLRASSDVRVRTRKKFPGPRSVGGKFSMGSRMITLYLQEIEEQCFQLFGSLRSADDYFTIILAHEIGHAHDPLLEQLSDELDCCPEPLAAAQLALRIEQNAWNYAAELIPEVDRFLFEKIVECSLEAYYERIQQEVSIASGELEVIA
ncbi:hypothetical protein [Paenibacillus campi]|uniref:hypothetical protein n=1 Tax=Paenibacillus campi TaxID=3106031 RepID=UPI002AFDE606|nr:hypothetical protein [Paenibacillus sp. SGZ-1014]